MNSTQFNLWKAELQNDLCGRKIIVASCQTHILNSTQAIESKVYSYLVWFKLIQEYSHFINADYSVVSSPLGERCGDKINGTSWNGAIGMIKNGVAEIGIDFTNTVHRLEAIEFSIAFIIDKFVIVTKEPVAKTNSEYFLNVYSTEIYILILVALLSVGSLSFVFEAIVTRASNQNNLLHLTGNIIWRCYRLLRAEYVKSTMLGSNLLILTWLLALQVLVPCYNNFIYARFATPIKPRPIDSGNDLLNAVTKGEMTWGTYFNSIYYKLFESAPEGTIMQKLFQHSPPTWNPPSFESYNQRVLDENYALIDTEIYVKMRRVENSEYHISTSGFSLLLDSIAMDKNSPHKRLVNFYIQYARDYGLIRKWEHDMELEIKRDYIPTNDKTVLNLQVMRLVFYTLATGLILSGLVFAIELLTARECQKVKEKNEKPLRRAFSPTFIRTVTELVAQHPIVTVTGSSSKTQQERLPTENEKYEDE